MSGAVNIFVGSGRAPQLTLTNDTVSQIATAPAICTFTLQNNGATYTDTQSTWLVGGSPANYDVRATLTGGTALFSGTTGTWLNLGTSRSWQTKSSNISGGVRESIVLFEFVATGTTSPVLRSATITIHAENA